MCLSKVFRATFRVLESDYSSATFLVSLEEANEAMIIIITMII